MSKELLLSRPMAVTQLSSNDFTPQSDIVMGGLNEEFAISSSTEKVETLSGNDIISAINSSWALSVSGRLFTGSGADALTGLCTREGSANQLDFLLGDIAFRENAVIRMGAGADRVDALSINGLFVDGDLYTGGGNDIVRSGGRIYGHGKIFLGAGADTVIGCLTPPVGLNAYNTSSSLNFYGGSGRDHFVLLEGTYSISVSQEPGMSYRIEAVSGASAVPESAHLAGFEYLGDGANAVEFSSLRSGLISVSADGVISQPA